MTGTLTYALAPLMLVASLLIGLIGYFTGTMTCADGCVAVPEHWSDDKDAPEWGNIVLFSWVIVITACVCVGAVFARARHLALGALLLHGASLLYLIGLLNSASRGFDLSGAGVLVFAPVVLGAVAVVCLYADVRLAGDR